MDLEKSDKLQDINLILNESFAPYFTDAFSRGETKEQVGMNTITGLSSFVSDVNTGTIGGLRGWTTSIVFSSTVYNSVSWTSGTINLSNGITYSVSAGSLTITATHYIFLDTAVSSTILQNTTISEDSVGGTRLLIAFVKISSPGLRAIVKAFGGQGDSFLTDELNIANGAINAQKTNLLAISALTGALNPSTVDTTQIVDNAITSLKILNGAISTAKIALLAIDSSLIAANAVTSTKILDDSITSPKILAGAIVAGKIAVGTIVANDIATGAITTTKIFAGAVTANEIAANAIVAGKIAVGTIVANDIAAGAITTAKIFAGAVTAAQIATGTITANEIATGTITANKIASNTITANEIAANTITSNNILTGSIKAEKIDVTNLFAQTINATGSITGATLQTAISGARSTMSPGGNITATDAAGNTISVNPTNNQIGFQNGVNAAYFRFRINSGVANLETDAIFRSYTAMFCSGLSTGQIDASGTINANGKMRLPVGTNLF